ncbi:MULTISPECIES: hypothetical protein [unclassified Microbacterium]|uniref:hypothetical protein n=1 Tax=unclassified Microbacterium TaxID=2609290 RepID=UPI000EA9B77B|nr:MULTISPECIES: hypothetical protein [unclassified Microbacterium]MBT2484841.1 hypothetical protein [Microbacterium sp. ISL-108]RKN67711.1 hypothetical protein D7252_08990 [Microbacterium sp. CGR2]
MTFQLSADPGKNTGISLGYYDATTPYQLLQRWQVHHGLEGFLRWLDAVVDELEHVDEIIVERFIANHDEDGDLSGVPIEGAIALWARQIGAVVIWQTRFDKGALTGYPDDAVTKAQRQRVRFDWLAEHGFAKAGTENDDTNDAITHGIVSLRKRKHMPTIRAFWGRGRKDAA